MILAQKCRKMRLAAGLRPDPLVSLQRSPGPLAGFQGGEPISNGKGRKGIKRNGEGRKERKGRGRKERKMKGGEERERGGSEWVCPLTEILNTPLVRLEHKCIIQPGRQELSLSTVRRRKLSWFGHVCRHDTLPKITPQGTVDGSRRRGRPRKLCKKKHQGIDRRVIYLVPSLAIVPSFTSLGALRFGWNTCEERARWSAP